MDKLSVYIWTEEVYGTPMSMNRWLYWWIHPILPSVGDVLIVDKTERTICKMRKIFRVSLSGGNLVIDVIVQFAEKDES